MPDDFEVPFGKARIRRSGSDLSIITYGNTTHMAVQVADRISDETGKEIEVLDIRSLIPLDKEAIVATVKKTSRVLVVHEEKVFAGFGSELASFVAEEAFVFLDAPVKRVGSTFTPVGFNPILEKAILPNADKIYAAAMEILKF